MTQDLVKNEPLGKLKNLQSFSSGNKETMIRISRNNEAFQNKMQLWVANLEKPSNLGIL